MCHQQQQCVTTDDVMHQAEEVAEVGLVSKNIILLQIWEGKCRWLVKKPAD